MHFRKFLPIWAALISSASIAQDSTSPEQIAVQTGGVSAIWIMANICYAGMRAQGSTSSGWRIISFIVGLPGTLLTYFVVGEDSGRAYGIELPKKRE